MRYALPVRRRALLTLRQWLSGTAEVVRAPFRRPQILLVAGDAPPSKVAEVEKRLEFMAGHLNRPLTVSVVQHASASDLFLSAAVATLEKKTITDAAHRAFPWVANLDYDSNPDDGWDLADLATAVSRNGWRRAAKGARQTFTDHVNAIREHGSRPVYLFGTGPSLQSARERSFVDGTTVVCNTIVRDSDLWHHLAPSFLTAGDAIYHFGHTPHARAFRADALLRLKESEGRTLFVYPSMFDVIVRSEFHDVQSLLVPIPIGGHTDITVDLTEQYSLPKLGNVLNHLLLPLGCTVSKDVRLWGFDGRAPKDAGFWSNSDRHSYPELMQSIRDAHPAFFANLVPEGKEVQYVQRFHGDILDERLSDAEHRGYQFQMLHKTWTPTLQKRFHG